MKDAGPAWMSIGRGTGQNRAINAAKEALSSPLLDVTMQGAKGVLFNIAGADLTLFEVNEAAEIIRQAVDPQANVIFGVLLDPNMGKDVRLTMVATGFKTRETTRGSEADVELTNLLKDIDDDELDIPSFSRQHGTYKVQRTATGRMN